MNVLFTTWKWLDHWHSCPILPGCGVGPAGEKLLPIFNGKHKQTVNLELCFGANAVGLSKYHLCVYSFFVHLWAALTGFDVTRLATEPLGKLLAIPHQQLLVGLHRPDGVKVDVPAVLARHQVLFGQRTGRVDVTHPVAPVDVVAIDEVLKLTVAVNLQKKKKRGVVKNRHWCVCNENEHE